MCTSKTPFAETNALLAILEDDESSLQKILGSMSERELVVLARNALDLSHACGREVARRVRKTQGRASV